MAQILVRDIDDDVKERLQPRAARHGRSLEAEVRDVLRRQLEDEAIASGSLCREIATFFKGIGLREGEDISQLRGHTIRNSFED